LRSPKREATLEQKLKRIRMVVMDADGVLTDGRIILGSDGADYRCFHAHDGYGIVRAIEKGLKCAIISGRGSKAIELRAKRLGITDIIQRSMDKVKAFQQLKRKYKVEYEEVCFIGDDEFDLPLLLKVGFSAAPKDGIQVVRDQVDYVTEAKGGRGAVREILDRILRAQKRL